MVKGTGPVISNPPRSIEAIQALTNIEDAGEQLPFVGETLRVGVWVGGVCVCLCDQH